MRGLANFASPADSNVCPAQDANILRLPANYSQQKAQPLAIYGIASVEQLSCNEATSLPN
jgi:hypothetical protein